MSTYTMEQHNQLDYVQRNFASERDLQINECSNGWILTLTKRFHDESNIEIAKHVENAIAATVEEAADISYQFIKHGTIPSKTPPGHADNTLPGQEPTPGHPLPSPPPLPSQPLPPTPGHPLPEPPPVVGGGPVQPPYVPVAPDQPPAMPGHPGGGPVVPPNVPVAPDQPTPPPPTVGGGPVVPPVATQPRVPSPEQPIVVPPGGQWPAELTPKVS